MLCLRTRAKIALVLRTGAVERESACWAIEVARDPESATSASRTPSPHAAINLLEWWSDPGEYRGGRYLTAPVGMAATRASPNAMTTTRRARVEALGVRIVNQFEQRRVPTIALHPPDTGGSFF